jgi:hypothetical protein
MKQHLCHAPGGACDSIEINFLRGERGSPARGARDAVIHSGA